MNKQPHKDSAHWERLVWPPPVLIRAEMVGWWTPMGVPTIEIDVRAYGVGCEINQLRRRWQITLN